MIKDTAMYLWFVFCALLSIGWLVFLGWAIYTLVNWVVTK